MKRVILVLALSGVAFLAAVAPVGCNNQLLGVMALLCPDCYADWQSRQGGN